MSTEIERRFLLCALPRETPDDLIEIHQWYKKTESGQWERARCAQSERTGLEFTKTIKTRISTGVSEEEEIQIDQEEFNKFVKDCELTNHTSISKQRYVWLRNDLKWEIDVFFAPLRLIIMEVELPSLNKYMEIPDFIYSNILQEITGLTQFSNRGLSKKLKNLL